RSRLRAPARPATAGKEGLSAGDRAIRPRGCATKEGGVMTGERHAVDDGRAEVRDRYVWLPIEKQPDQTWAQWQDAIRKQLQQFPPAPNGIIRNSRWDVPDHSNLQACVASAVASAIELQLGPGTFRPSVPFIYYAARYFLLDEYRNKGISTYNALRACFYFGFCSNDDWPLSPIIDPQTPPTKNAELEARKRGIDNFLHLDRRAYGPYFLALCKQAILAGYSIIFAASVTDEFIADRDHSYLYKTPYVKVPGQYETADNSHSLLAVEYHDGDGPEDGYFVVRDSFDSQKGDGGYLYMPYEYFTTRSLTRNFWIIEKVILDVASDD